MKIPIQWLKEWIDAPWSVADLGARLTMAGFELEAMDETFVELNVTPNRGDAMSVLGIAREVAALSGLPLQGPSIEAVPAAHADTLAVKLAAPAACPKFVGRIVHGVDNRATTPAWMRERLQSAGVRSISPIVDVTNYVLLELGQPMHVYDFAKLQGGITVRTAGAQEKVTLLDGRTVEAGEGTLLIADSAGPVGVAGIMGGDRTSASESTTDIFLEVAYFAPDAIVGRARKLGLQTDASQRYERGVDPALQERATERATALIIEIAGGKAGPTQVAQAAEHLPARSPVSLRRKQLARLLGAAIEPALVTKTLRSLGMRVTEGAEGWAVTPPSHRFDVTIEADLIEEVARIVGYQAIPETHSSIPQRFRELPSHQPNERSVLEALAARGYQEAITLAFVDPALQQRLFPQQASLTLTNPIASDLAVMRVSLWPGLLRAALENQRRQQDRIRLVEHGRRFLPEEIDTLAGIVCGPRWPEQWGASKEMRIPADFFDVQGDLKALAELTFESALLSCLHPGRAARVKRAGQAVGWLGELHPALASELGFTYAPVLFELDYENALRIERPAYKAFSRFPQVRRDLALVIDESLSFSALRERVLLASPIRPQDCLLFDVYRGPGVETGRKSVALGLIFQDISRTLMDEEIDGAMAAIVAELRAGLNAKIRE